MIDDLAAHLPATTATWVLILTGITGLAFALSAFACDRLGYKIISAFLAAGAWLCCRVRGFGLVLAIGSVCGAPRKSKRTRGGKQRLGTGRYCHPTLYHGVV